MPNLAQFVDVKSVIVFIAGIASAAFVQWLRTRSEHGQWLRQQRLEAYAAFVGAMDAMERLQSRWSVSWGKTDEADQVERYYDGLEGLSRSAGRVHLLAGSPLVSACVRAQRHWDLEVQAALRLKETQRLLDGYPESRRLYNDMVAEARAELGRPKSPLSKNDAEALMREGHEGNKAALRAADAAGKPIDTLPHP